MSTGFALEHIEQMISALTDDERQRLAVLVAPIRDRLLAQRPRDAKALRRDMAAAARAHANDAAMRDHVKRVVDAAPPLSEEQRARLAALLASARGATPKRRAPQVSVRPEDTIVDGLKQLLQADPIEPALRERVVTLLAGVCGDTSSAVPWPRS
ncbi:hypothetical protein [Dactylosporangium darangshiense]|uniref:Uncharacterized protein n=1 Tax=Dactylosporangium darangshiense TaxID=579108 RepID=A0ABP8DNK4_9ACTN